MEQQNTNGERRPEQIVNELQRYRVTLQRDLRDTRDLKAALRTELLSLKTECASPMTTTASAAPE